MRITKYSETISTHLNLVFSVLTRRDKLTFNYNSSCFSVIVIYICYVCTINNLFRLSFSSIQKENVLQLNSSIQCGRQWKVECKNTIQILQYTHNGKQSQLTPGHYSLHFLIGEQTKNSSATRILVPKCTSYNQGGRILDHLEP